MISLSDRASLKNALNAPVRSDLKPLLFTRIRHALDAGLADLTHIVVVEGQDCEQAIIDEIGFSPATSPLDGIRYTSPGFIPGWAWLEDFNGWFEMIWPVADSGFAFILLIEDTQQRPSDLIIMCRRHLRCASKRSL